MNYQFDYQMEHPHEWREDYVVLLADEQVQLSGLFLSACGVGSRFDDLRARLWRALGDGDERRPERCAAEAA